MSEQRHFIELVPSPIGLLRLVTDEEGALHLLGWGGEGERIDLLRGDGKKQIEPHAGVSQARRAVEAYFAGDLAALDGVTARPAGTEFQRQVWAALRTIPVGATASYGEIAAQIGQKGAARAVGAANNRNPVAIVIPCHRVIGANGALVGYGGGLERKLLLLRHEGAIF
jgi:methylated-DNA-[protein]-cysteine S-methyltransferase